MALIACPECGSMVSSNAPACPKCGHTVKKEGGGCLLSAFRVVMLLIAVFCLIGAFSHSWVWALPAIICLLLGAMVKRVA